MIDRQHFSAEQERRLVLFVLYSYSHLNPLLYSKLYLVLFITSMISGLSSNNQARNQAVVGRNDMRENNKIIKEQVNCIIAIRTVE